jgi:hypothetical protein
VDIMLLCAKKGATDWKTAFGAALRGKHEKAMALCSAKLAAQVPIDQ